MSLTATTNRSRGRSRWATVALAGTALAVTTSVAVSSAAPAQKPSKAATTVVQDQACPTSSPRHAECMAVVNSDATGKPLSRAAAQEAGVRAYTAADIQEAYNLPSELLGARQTIAIVDAYDNPNAEADLAVYRAENNLPPCTSEDGCFRKVNQRGESTPPSADPGWAMEIALDLDMASAACPNCQLLLVEADDNLISNLGQAVDKAVELGATVISNSYGAVEAEGILEELGSHYDHPGTTMVASSGDFGFGAQVPAALSTVVAVGGTTMVRDSSPRGWSETAWAAAGSGCSFLVAKPKWQKDKLCSRRTVADVAAVADPDTPVAVYNTFAAPGWVTVGGTSASAPIIAGVYALAGNAATINPGKYLYDNSRSLFDVTAGSNGNCGGSYLCTAVKGYDGPTGLGTPNGIGAF